MKRRPREITVINRPVPVPGGPGCGHCRPRGTTERVSLHNDGSEIDDYSYAGGLFGRRRYVLFHSYGELEGGATDNWYVRDRQAGTTELISVKAADARRPTTVAIAPGRHLG